MALGIRFSSLLFVLALLSSAVHAVGTLTDDDLRNIPSGGSDFDIHTGKLLAPILIPRVPGTEGSHKTQKHFVDFFKDNLPEWEILWQNSTAKTPLSGNKEVPFSNLIFRRDPPGSRTGDVGRLTLVAHYDSKIEPEGFIGATDSAAPCAMLLHVARSIDLALGERWELMEKNGELDDDLDGGVGVQILLLDGEEAFVQWSATDSIYGARALAAEWESQFHETMSIYRTPLQSISLFVLLDLLGSANPTIPSYFLPTHWAYQNMADIEERMRRLGLLETTPPKAFLPDKIKPADEFTYGYIEDDHIPFMKKGVDILHIIAHPFPTVWHTMDDDGEHLDLATVRDWAKIVTAFAAEWMNLSGHLPKLMSSTAKRRGDEVVERGSAESTRTEL